MPDVATTSPPLRLSGSLQVSGPRASFAVVGVDDGIELRVDTLRQAWAIRRATASTGAAAAGPLAALTTWWRISRMPLHVVVAGRRIATADPASPQGRRTWGMPAPWKLKRRATLAVLGRSLVGRA